MATMRRALTDRTLTRTEASTVATNQLAKQLFPTGSKFIARRPRAGKLAPVDGDVQATPMTNFALVIWKLYTSSISMLSQDNGRETGAHKVQTFKQQQ